MKQDRRKFMGTAAAAGLTFTGLSSFVKSTAAAMKPPFIHHVFFWLKDPASTTDRDKLMKGLNELSKVKTIKSFHIGKPANTNRDVIERGYAISGSYILMMTPVRPVTSRIPST